MAPSKSTTSRRSGHGRLLRGASLLVIGSLLDPALAAAQSAAMLRGAAHIASSTGVPAIVAPANEVLPRTPAMASASARAILNQAHLGQSTTLAMQAQAAARAAAASLDSNIPNGLGIGGLNPVGAPLSASADPTGLSTWQGASAPVQTQSGGQTTVTVTQTDPRAILSWITFNVGAATTLDFSQKSSGVAQPNWIALNRVVGQIDPSTGLRDPGTAPAPSQILGKIHADGEVLILNPNGVLFGATAQVNTYSLVAASLDVGRSLATGSIPKPLTIAQRDQSFLSYGLLGYAEQDSVNNRVSDFTFSAEAVDGAHYDPTLEGAITIEAGAQITSADTGFLLFTGPKVVNSGQLTSPDGQISLQSGRQIILQTSDGTATSINPYVRGLVVTSVNRPDSDGNYVENTSEGLIQANDGFVSLGATAGGAVINQGLLASSTSISRNGFVQLTGGNIQLAPSSTISITPDDAGGTIPQDPTSLADFKSSRISIGDSTSRIEIGANALRGALIYAPSATVSIGAAAGPTTIVDGGQGNGGRIFIDSGVTIDVSGLKNVEVPASTNAVEITPVTTNDLQNSPNDKALLGATVFVDPRLSGVRADGVAWVGSPLISATSYVQQVGVKVSQLMTVGGNLVLGVASADPANAAAAPDVIVKPGAVLDISGGWVTYQAGLVQTSRLIDSNGQVVDISQADPNATYVGVYSGFTASQPRWGVSQNYADPVQLGATQAGAYTEGRDAGSLVIKGSVVALDGTVYADAFAGPQQILDAKAGTATSTVYGDNRTLQGAPSQLPSGGLLFIQAQGVDPAGVLTGGANIEVTAGPANTSIADLKYGQSVSIDTSGDLVAPTRDPATLLPVERVNTIVLSAPALNATGLSEVSLQTSGSITVDQGANLTLEAGGAFFALSGRALTIDGTISTPSGRISLTTAQLLGVGSTETPDAPQLGSYDLTINGGLLVNGRWVNDMGVAAGALQGAAFLNGGSISLTAAPRVSLLNGSQTVASALSDPTGDTNTDISGSILINQGALLNLSGGGYVAENGALQLTSKGGNLSLTEATTYFDLQFDPNAVQAGAIPGFRVGDILDPSNIAVIPVNPATINARVAIAPGSILADGFAGGGTFSLTTPELTFGSGVAATGTELPLDFFSTAGFGAYNITSYKTALLANQFDNGLGGYNAVLQTQVLTVGAGQTLNLTQSGFSPLVDDAQMSALRALPSGGDLYSVSALTRGVPTAVWDRLPVNLTLGGLIELDVAPGGNVVGAPGAGLTVSQLQNEGLIRLPGGTLTQSEVLPQIYTLPNTVAVQSLGQAFSADGLGRFQEGDANLLGLTGGTNILMTNAQVAAQGNFFLLGDLAQGVGVNLAPGGITDLSGVAVVNPRAKVVGQGVYTSILDGKVVAGGVLQAMNATQSGANLFQTTPGQSVYSAENPLAVRVGLLVTADGATIDVAGSSATFDEQRADGTFGPTPVWSNGGALSFGGGAILQEVNLRASGGAPDALGGTLTIPNLVLTQKDLPRAGLNTLSAQAIEAAGVSTLVDQGQLTTLGDVTLHLDRAFFLTSAAYANGALSNQTLSTAAGRQQLAPTISAGGDLVIDAPYIAFVSAFQSLASPATGILGGSTVTFSAQAIDVVGAVLFDQSIAKVNLKAGQDLRLVGVEPWQQVFGVNAAATPNSLGGELAVNGDLNITAAQVYPTTGSSFSITSTGVDRTINPDTPHDTITFAQTPGSTPAAPYSAGGALKVQAVNIVQDGVVRAPLGSLTLGSNTALTDATGLNVFAPPTLSLTVATGSTTSVSASGLSIPYGITTDQTEWYFTPTNANPLKAPPAGVLKLSGDSISIEAGATVDMSGGGDVYAYEFIPGTGGSHDVLTQFNTDIFTSNAGYQYPDHRQVYAIVPGLSDAAAAAYDPNYSSNYASLYGPSQVGAGVYLNGGPGLAAGWYTLLPAQYAMLPGGMRVVQDTSAATPPPGGGSLLADGTVVVSGQYGVAGTSSRSSTITTFDVQSQSTFLKYSDIVLTSGNTKFAADAALNKVVSPRLAVDAGRLVLDPVSSLDILSTIVTTPGKGGRGAQVDITGAVLDIVSATGAGTAGGIELTADELTNLNASSLLLGGERTETSDGQTDINVTASSITVENNSTTPLSAPEVILAVDGSRANINITKGAVITATGAADPGQAGDFVISGGGGMTGQGALVRIANGPERLVTRENVSTHALGGLLRISADASLSGTSMLLDSTGSLLIAPTTKLSVTNLALDSSHIDFVGAPLGDGGLTITQKLATVLASVSHLTLRSPNPIAFQDGHYTFGDLTLDTPGLWSVTEGSAYLTAKSLNLSNSHADIGQCDFFAYDCGFGDLHITTGTIVFGSGTVRTFGFGKLTELTAPGGVFAEGSGVFDVGTGDLLVETPFVGDRATPATVGSTTSAKAALTLTSQASVTLINTTGAAAPETPGTPGSSLTVNGTSIAVAGVTLRATAGRLTLNATGDIDITAISLTTGQTTPAKIVNALLETPGYSKSFGDAADPYSISAPGGVLSLNALGGDINLTGDGAQNVSLTSFLDNYAAGDHPVQLAAVSGATLSVGGGAGKAGVLSLVATGSVNLLDGVNGARATVDASAPGGGAGFNLATGASFDLSAFETAWGSAFTGDQAIRSAQGDLRVSKTLTLAAANVSLTADGGLVDVAGVINVSGVNGGDVDLFGAEGVTLESTAQIKANASGYGITDTRQATGGLVTIGTDGAGAIQVASGAVIDVSARRPGDRFVPLASGGAGAFSYAQSDQGGDVVLRAPVLGAPGAQTVNIGFAGSIVGAQSVVLEGFEHIDLAAVASSGQYVGVQLSPSGLGEMVLDLRTAGSPGTPNFLADNAPGTLVNFIQTFDLSRSNASLGGLISLAGFSERPGVELDYSGAVTLASNWNLGAGSVDVAGAVAAGLMAPDPNIPGAYYVIPGDQAAVFSNYTTMTYRTGGRVDGQPGVLSIHAGGQLDIQGSITDGFFTFADQTDPAYVSLLLGGGAPGTGGRVYQGYLTPGCAGGDCGAVGTFDPHDPSPAGYVSIAFPNSSGLSSSFTQPFAPYNAAANAPDALGSIPGGGGDPIGSAQLFPLITVAGRSSASPVESWSYRLVGGADTSSNPLLTAAGSTDGVVVEGLHPYVLSATAPLSTFAAGLDLQAGEQILNPAAWLAAYESLNALGDNAYTLLDFSTAPGGIRPTLSAAAAAFFTDPSTSVLQGANPARPTGVATTLKQAEAFLALFAQSGAVTGAYRAPNSHPFTGRQTVDAPTLIRTGTGSISIAAAGTIDLRNGETPTLVDASGNPATAANGGLPLGGVAIYTAGHMVDTGARQITDQLSGQSYTLDPSNSGQVTDNLGAPPAAGYLYGVGAGGPSASGVGYTGVLIADPVYAEGGGDISLTAGLDVLGRRDLAQSARLSANFEATASFGYGWIGQGDQAWRTGVIGATNDIRIDPQLFQEGVGALGGGSISIVAGRTVSDLSVVADTTIATGTLTDAAAAPAGKALMTFGGGDVSIAAGGDLLGGRVDVASGQATIAIGGDVASAGLIGTTGSQFQNTLLLRLTDATIDLNAQGSVELQGVTALGVRNSISAVQGNLDAMGFYSADSGVSIVADGSVSIDNVGGNSTNIGASVLTPNVAATGGGHNAVYPGSLEADALTGDLNLATPGGAQAAGAIILYPSPDGTVTLAAAGNISHTILDMEDAAAVLLPGAFSSFTTDQSGNTLTGLGFSFAAVLPSTPQTTLAQLHNSTPTHTGDATPNRLYAGGDILDMTLSTPKSARIGAGRDIVNMVFFGQNLAASDITRIVAGRDITATTQLVTPVIALPAVLGPPLPAVQGNTFILGGPGSLFLEAGRNAGPFLNSAVTNGFTTFNGASSSTGPLSYGGGVLSVGNEWNPWLPQKGADIYTEFGVANGQDFGGLLDAYLNPANLASMPAYLFAQVTDAAGLSAPDRSKPIYAPILIAWMQSHASAALVAAYGSADAISFQQAYDVFKTLPELEQRTFLLKDVYFNELAQTSIPTGSSYLQYSRGYRAVNTLFPAGLGYTANSLAGGANGASQTVTTGNLDLRLATIQTDQGGDILILGPGGRVLAGSTVSTSEQAARRAYVGGALFNGGAANSPLAASITSIPVGAEGILTLQGGAIYTFTDQSFLLNQSRLFTEAGGDIIMWSSNADLNAGEGTKTSANFPPIAVTFDENAYSQVNKDANVSGAGIAAFESTPGQTPPNVYLIAPRGTVDAGAAGVRVGGNLFIAANSVANADNFKVSGSSSGIPATGAVNVGAQTSGGNAAAAAAKQAESAAGASGPTTPRSLITVNVQGYSGEGAAQPCSPEDKSCKR